MDRVIKNADSCSGKGWASIFQVIPARSFYALQIEKGCTLNKVSHLNMQLHGACPIMFASQSERDDIVLNQ